MKNKIIFFLCVLASSLFSQEIVKPDTTGKLDWFRDAKLGIFIHYGIYAVKGTSESWAFRNNLISYEDYMKQLDGFTAKNYNPSAWAKLFKEVGAKYAVLTSKHHDGVALWDTKLSDLSVVKKTPAKRDLITPYANALRKEGLKVGIYFSHIDWSHPDYASVFNGSDTLKQDSNYFDVPKSRKEDPEKWNRFVEFRDKQIKEVNDLTHPDLWWFDGDWTRTAEQWKMKELRETLLSWNPKTILNSRMKGYGDYGTPELSVPIYGPDVPFELCMRINDSWGYQPQDRNFKSLNYIIRVFADCISLGGNLLLDVGPMEDGTLTPEQTDRLVGLGRWIKKHAEAIYGSQRGLPLEYYLGPTTISKDKKTVYCFVMDIPKGELVVKGIKNKINGIRLLGTNEKLNYVINGGAPWKDIPGVILVTLPQDKIDQNVTVFAIDLDSPLKLYNDKK